MIRHLEAEAGLEFQAWPATGGAIDYRPWLPGAKLGGRTVEIAGFSLGDLGPEWSDKVRVDPGLRSEHNLLEYYRQSMHLSSPDSPAMKLAGMGAAEVDQWWRGTALAGALFKACLDRGVDVRMSTPAGSTSCSRTAASSESVATHGDEVIELRAPHVLMATGGYTHNEELKKLWLKTAIVYTCDVDSNQGDGHLMGMAAGAQTAGLGDAWWMPHVPMAYDGAIVQRGGAREDRILPHTMMVNPSGKRFMNEAVNYYDAGESFGEQGRSCAAELPRLVGVRPTGRRDVRDPRLQDPAGRQA